MQAWGIKQAIAHWLINSFGIDPNIHYTTLHSVPREQEVAKYRWTITETIHNN